MASACRFNEAAAPFYTHVNRKGPPKNILVVNCNQNGEVIDRKPKIEAFIDNNDAYEAVYSLKQEMKGRLRIDIACIKEMVAEKRGGFCYLDSCITPFGGLPYQEGCIYQSSSQDSQQRMLLTLERKGLDVYILHMVL